MAPRKRVKGKKPTETMRQRQQRLLREQRAAKAKTKTRTVKTNPTGAPRGAHGPATPPQQGPSRRTPSTIGGDTGRRGGVNKYGTKGTPKSGPPGVGKPPRFNPSIRIPARGPGLGAAGLAISTGAALGEAYRRTDRAKSESARGEGRRTFSAQSSPQRPFSKPPQSKSKPGVQGRNTRGSQGGSRASAKRKPQQPAKPKREVTSRNRRGRPTNYAKPAKRGMSNIPPKEGTGQGSPNDKKPAVTTKRQNVTPKTQPKSTPKVKKGNGVERRLTKSKERKDRAYAAVQELRAMRERFKERQSKKKKQSRANQAGWQGNRNY